ncbi:MAG: hypothetical protein AB8F78_19010 [Saprospiraceae bacterium]
MSNFHEPGISKTSRITGYVLTILASIGVLGSGLIKFFPNEEINQVLGKLGLEEHSIAIGLVEVLVVVIYWIPKTVNFGFFIFCSYLGGIVVGEIMLGDIPIPGLVLGAMVYIGTFLRKPSLLG